MRWLRDLHARVRGNEQARLTALVAEGRTVELAEMSPRDEVVRIALRYGDEFWRVGPGWEADPVRDRIDGADLIVEDGRRVVDEGRLSFIEGRIRRVVYRT